MSEETLIGMSPDQVWSLVTVDRIEPHVHIGQDVRDDIEGLWPQAPLPWRLP